MACTGDDFCFEAWVSSCDLVGQSCIPKARMWDVFANQERLADQIAPTIEDVSSAASCTRVYLDTTTCLFTTTAGANTVAVGIHAFDGRVIFDGKTACADIGQLNNAPAPCGTRLDADMNPTTGCDVQWLTLEDDSGSGCVAVMKYSEPFEYHDSFGTNGSFGVGANNGTLVSGDFLIVPTDGRYFLSYDVGYFGTGQPIFSGVTINGLGINGIQYATANGDVSTSRAFDLCLNASDVLRVIAVNAGTTNLVSTRRSLQLRYLGCC